MTWCGASDDAAFDRVKQSKACDERASSRFGPVNQMTACERSGAVLDDAHSFASGAMFLWVDMVERRGLLMPLIPAGSLGCSIDFFQCVAERNHGGTRSSLFIALLTAALRPQWRIGGGLWGEKRPLEGNLPFMFPVATDAAPSFGPDRYRCRAWLEAI
jgi:hypothetical protein